LCWQACWAWSKSVVRFHCFPKSACEHFNFPWGRCLWDVSFQTLYCELCFL